MNYFGLFFSFMIPGVVAASAVKEAAAKKSRRQAMMRRRAMHTVPKNKLYVSTIEERKAA